MLKKAAVNSNESARTEVSFTVPLIPPSGNHYKKPNGRGGYYLTPETVAYRAAVAFLARGARVRAAYYELTATMWLGKGQRLDGDNGWKVLADSLQRAGVIHSDAAIADWHMYVRRDWARMRTEITVRAIELPKGEA